MDKPFRVERFRNGYSVKESRNVWWWSECKSEANNICERFNNVYAKGREFERRKAEQQRNEKEN